MRYILFIITFLLIFNGFLYASEIASSGLSVKGDHLTGELYIRNQLIFKIHQEGKADPEVLACEIAKKINKLYSGGISVSKVRSSMEIKEIKENKDGEEVKKQKVMSASIYWDKEKLFTITLLQAKLNNTTPDNLASEFIGNLKKYISLEDSFKIFPSNLFLTPDETGEIKFVSNFNDKLTWKTDKADIIELVKMPSGNLQVKAKKIGDTSVEFQYGKFRSNSYVSVREYGGTISKPDEIILSGSVWSSDFIQNAVIGEINRSVKLKKNARLIIDSFNIQLSPPEEGTKCELSVPVTIQGEGYTKLEKTLSVTIRNEKQKIKKPSLFLMCNSPEKILKNGILFQENISSDGRLLFYHLNSSEKEKYIVIELLNSGSENSKVWVVSGYGGPNPQEAFVGHVATSRFVKNSYYSAGQFYTIKPGERKAIYIQKMKKGEILTGLAHIQFLSKSSINVIVRAEEDVCDKPSTELLPPDENSTHSRGVFGSPEISISESYSSGEPEKSIYIGNKPFLVSPYDKKELYGNYGIIYDIKLKLINKDNKLKDIDIFFTSQGGIAQGTFIINGCLVETPIVRSSERVSLATFLLKPGEERLVTLQTIPQGGSHYPVRIVIKD